MLSNTNVETVGNTTLTDAQHTTVNKGNVEVSSTINHGAQNTTSLNVGSQKLDELIDRLSTTHEQIDQYTQRRTHQISVETRNIINQILEQTKEKQRELLLEVQIRSQQLQEEYQNDLQIKINQLNEEKAQHLADLEKNLNIQQENILNNAKFQIDSLQRDANLRKMNILQQAQEISNAQIEQITEQVVTIGQEDSANRLASKTTTVITTQSVAQG